MKLTSVLLGCAIMATGGLAITAVVQAQNQFAHEITSLYDAEARVSASITGEDRGGHTRAFPLMRVSAAVVRVPAGRGIRTTDEVVQLMTSLKKDAKQAKDNIASVTLPALQPQD